jgi:hypothetical protein
LTIAKNESELTLPAFKRITMIELDLLDQKELRCEIQQSFFVHIPSVPDNVMCLWKSR